jgi:hypothetical protein
MFKFRKQLTILITSILIAGNVYAGNQGNTFSAGTDDKGIEINEDSSTGALTPITSGGCDLGSTTRKFHNLVIDGTQTIGGNTSITGTLGVTGNTTLTGSTTFYGKVAFVRDDGVSAVSGALNSVCFTSATQIIPVSSYVSLITTGVIYHAGSALPWKTVISTVGAITGQYLVIGTTCTNGIFLPTGTAHYIVGASSPMYIISTQPASFIFDGTYWVNISSN